MVHNALGATEASTPRHGEPAIVLGAGFPFRTRDPSLARELPYLRRFARAMSAVVCTCRMRSECSSSSWPSIECSAAISRRGASPLCRIRTPYSEMPNVYVMAAGTEAPNPAELLGSEAFSRFLAAMLEKFDTVIVDEAGMNAFPKTAIAAALCTVALSAAAGPALAQARPPRQPIIDMHLHAHSLADYGGGMPGCTNRGPLEFPPVDPRHRRQCCRRRG